MPLKSQSIIEETKLLGIKMEERKYEISREMAENRDNDTEKALEIRAEIIQIIADSFRQDTKTVTDRIIKWGVMTGEQAINYGVALDESLKSTSNIRQILWRNIEEIVFANKVSIETIFEVARKIDPLLDQAVYAYSTAYVKSYKEVLDQAQENFLVLSAPVVPILGGMAVLPIIGGIDTDRADVLLQTALRESAKQDLTHLFIDLSGVAVVDTLVANYIFKIIQSLELVGVQAVLVGIRPEVAQTMVTLGINFSEVKTFSTMQQALSNYMTKEN
ncbi:STAS domain-containing protein [Virgibacillus necropolis]|uniref:Anti-anti-sigma factor n=1 Tax=Virgibacillus necropolis TaxID=163877 RepID=A0A221M7C5_9BACI|nr:STAS domain-containing protein [Virgibacillus necropolis]ASN03538.1 anti-anti-sigma factor [Virgibacillus necropolis]